MMGDFDTFVNILSGGTTDAFGFTHGDKATRSIAGIFNPVSPLIEGLGSNYQGNDVWRGIDRMVDLPGGEDGGVDSGVRWVGDQLPDSLRNAAPTIGATVGGIVGSYVPVLGTAVGAAIGSGVGNKLKGGTAKKDYFGDFVKSGTTYVAASALSGASNAAGGDSLGGGLTGEEAILAGADYGYNSLGEGVGTIAQSGYPTGSEAANFYATDEFGATSSGSEELVHTSPTGDSAPPTSISKPTWSDKAYDILKKNSSKIGDIGKALMTPEETGAGQGSMTAPNGSPVTPEEYAYYSNALSGEPMSKKATAADLSMWETEEQKKKRYNLDMTVNYLTNYNGKKKEETNNGYLR
jgi:hypothetical protein